MSAFVVCSVCGREHLVFAGLVFWCSASTERRSLGPDDRLVVGPEDVRAVSEESAT